MARGGWGDVAFHAHPDDTTEVDLIEMVCDWTAMSQEFGQDGGSARGWRVEFNAANREFIDRMIAKLDEQIAASADGESLA